MNICIIGTGYVGLVAAACLSEMGNDVKCIDVNPDVIDLLNNGKIHIYEPGLETLVKRNREEGRLTFDTDLAKGLEDALFVFSCVGTPPKKNGECDLSYVEQVAKQIGETITDYKIIINKSTVPVGTADMVHDIIQKELDRRGVEIEYDVVSNPEFLKEGDAVNDFLKPDRVIVGTDNVRTAKLLETLYAPFARSRDKMIIMGIRSAEMTKYAANCMLATKISFMNEIANICERVGADVGDVRTGIGSDKRIGYHFIYPGVGYGGSCFPKDIQALVRTANDRGFDARVLKAVEFVNEQQKKILAEMVMEHFHAKGKGGHTGKKPLAGKTIAVWGLSFKPRTDDMREAPSITIIKHLLRAGARVRAHDPVAMGEAKKVFKNTVDLFEEDYETLRGADALAVITEWNEFRSPDFSRIKKLMRSPVIFDGRNIYNQEELRKMGFTYYGIGRR